MKRSLYLVDVGVLLDEHHPEFSAYAIVYDQEHGYYDEAQYYTLDLGRAIAEAQEYVREGVDGTYGIVSFNSMVEYSSMQELQQRVKDMNEDDVHSNYQPENVMFSVKKENNQIVTDFIKIR